MSFSASFVPSANEFLGSVLHGRLHEPHKMSWSIGTSEIRGLYGILDFDAGETHEWYMSQPTTTFTYLQYRKEREAPFFHEFIVVELDNDTVCRFDRRGDPSTRTNAFTLEGMTAEDTAHVIHKHEDHYAHIEETSNMLMRIHFPDDLDLRLLLRLACFCIQKRDETRAYTLAVYNCYFFSWTIIIATVELAAGRFKSWADPADFEDWRVRQHGVTGTSNSIYAKVLSTFRIGRRSVSKDHSSLSSLDLVTTSVSGTSLSNLPTDRQERVELTLRAVIEPAMNTLAVEDPGVREFSDNCQGGDNVYEYISCRIDAHWKHMRKYGVILKPSRIVESVAYAAFLTALVIYRGTQFPRLSRTP
ncbi:hypothetical protein FRC07_007779 [Ceratobasidium sp. 392]|nr:hypothetical protein FRC07_007779 [Ceratobasidium sp. 392]